MADELRCGSGGSRPPRTLLVAGIPFDDDDSTLDINPNGIYIINDGRMPNGRPTWAHSEHGLSHIVAGQDLAYFVGTTECMESASKDEYWTDSHVAKDLPLGCTCTMRSLQSRSLS